MSDKRDADAVAAMAVLEALADDPGDWSTFAVRGAAERGAKTIEALLSDLKEARAALKKQDEPT